MRSTQYLYECNPNDFVGLGYKQAIEYKLNKATELLKQLYKDETEFYEGKGSYDDAKELRERIKHVNKAINYNKGLLDELTS